MKINLTNDFHNCIFAMLNFKTRRYESIKFKRNDVDAMAPEK